LTTGQKEQGINDYIIAYNFAQNGILPSEGSMLKQTNKLYEAFVIIEGVRNGK